jgi:hypothetical protein
MALTLVVIGLFGATTATIASYVMSCDGRQEIRGNAAVQIASAVQVDPEYLFDRIQTPEHERQAPARI